MNVHAIIRSQGVWVKDTGSHVVVCCEDTGMELHKWEKGAPISCEADKFCAQWLEIP